MIFSVFVSCPKGLEYLLEEELRGLGFGVSRVSPQGVYGEVDCAMIYRVCLWSRIASRVHLILLKGLADSPKALYALCRAFPWETIFSEEQTLAITFHGESPVFRHTLFGAQVIKDAVVDYFRESTGARPVVDRASPDILLQAYLKHDTITVSLDLTGYSLHQRGYRLQTGMAPLKENIAAALLVRARWPEWYATGYMLHDPCCGAGTLVIEAAMMAAKMAPGLLRTDQAFKHWKGHQPELWNALIKEARDAVMPVTVPLLGSDSDSELLVLAKSNAERAGVSAWIEWKTMPLSEARPPQEKGLLVTNPPYGVRLGEETELVPFYKEMGHVLHTYYQGWEAALLTSSVALAKALGLRSHKQYTLYNGALACKVYCITLAASNQLNTFSRTAWTESATMFANRLQKNYLHLQKWAKRNQISCYRVYDADLPEYAYAIDLYGDHVVLQEYAAPASIDPMKARQRSLEVTQVVPRILGIPFENMVEKQRKQQKGTHQYQKLNQKQRTLLLPEGRAMLKVNLTEYLDTGLFLDHRPLRLQFATLAKGVRFLNCFCYTATASVHAALAGAITVNVDLSNTYLAWAEENFETNQLDVSRHQFIQYDCLEWLKITKDRFDVIFLDPPSFSNSKRMETTLDIQRDHEALIDAARRLLNPGGILYFSTNLRQFKLSQTLATSEWVEDMTAMTIDLDFKRNPRIHQCFKIRNA
jgi:23S rRNA (guanine2445-N2)-methyltransferase / 23S rRNA (guanine2069-N7)-methyltransferase